MGYYIGRYWLITIYGFFSEFGREDYNLDWKAIIGPIQLIVCFEPRL
jgi:hypothetical protein